MRCSVCGFDSLPRMSFCGMCGTRLALTCPDCGFVNPPNYRFCGSCGRVLVEGAVRGEPLPSADEASTAADQPAAPLAAERLAAPTAAEQPTAAAEPEVVVAAVHVEPPSLGPSGDGAFAAIEVVPAREVRLVGERRMATVILADVQDSTNLMEEIGTEAWVSMMNRVFHILESEIYRYGGTVDQFRGDGLVAFFGTEVAHEDDPERAILASLSMQEAIEAYAAELAEREGIELRLRVGVNTGEVIVANIGDRARYSEDTAMGKAIALAARMETSAEPGTVLVSEHTYHLIEGRFTWTPLGEITVKGIRQPVAIYRPLVPRSEAQRRLHLETYGLSALLVGRDKEFESLMQCIGELRAGTGCIVLLTGEEGMGKSYLVSQVQQQALKDEALLAGTRGPEAASTELLWLRGHCRSYEQTWPYSMWLDMLRRWLGAYHESREETRQRLHQESVKLWGERASEFCPYLAKLLSLPLDEDIAGWIEGLDAESLRQGFFVTLRAWVEAMTRRGPVVLTFDDVYWADVTSLELLEYCLPLCDHSPIMFLLMFRLQPDSTVWAFHHRVGMQYPQRTLSLVLDPLSDAQGSEMIDQLIGADALPSGMRAQIVERAEGNPYYIEELVRSLIRDGTLAMDEGTRRWRAVRAIDSLDLPGTLRNLLLARIDDLLPEQRHVLQMAAVIGVVFWSNVLQELLGQDVALGEQLAALQRAQFVVERGQVPELGTEYAFRSSLIRDLACDSVLSAQRVTYSRQVADHLARLFGKEVLAQYYGVVAYQYQCAREPRRELFYTLSAAEHAQGIYANVEALEYYTRALELLGELEAEDQDSRGGLWQDWRLESLKGLGQVSFGMGRIDEAEPYLRQAVALAQEVGAPLGELIRLYYWLCEVLFWQGRLEEQIQIARKGLSLLGDNLESVEAALMNQEIAVGHRASGDASRFVEFTLRTAQFLERLPYSEELRPAYDHVVSMYIYDIKDVDKAKRWLEIMEGRAAAHHDVRALAKVHGHAGQVLERTGDLVGAVSRYRQALERYERTGDAKQAREVLENTAEALLGLGELEQAQQCVDRALKMEAVPGIKGGPGWPHLYRGRILIARGDWQEAFRSVEQAVELFEDAGEATLVAISRYYLARIYLRQGDREAALRSLQEATAHTGPESVRDMPLALAGILTAMERAAESESTFRAFCREWHEQIPDVPLVQWFLEPAEPGAQGYPLFYDDRFAGSLASGWTWQDPLDDCVLRVQAGLQVHAANGRDLWHVNLSAPRVVRQVTGPWTAEAICEPVRLDQPAIGGCLVWKDKRDYLRLDYGSGGERCVMLLGCLDNRDVVIGRGLLPAEGDGRVYLRLERSGDTVRALVSTDGEGWLTLGQTAFPLEGDSQVGLYAAGNIDRVSYPGAHCEGTAIRFTRFRLWRGGE